MKAKDSGLANTSLFGRGSESVEICQRLAIAFSAQVRLNGKPAEATEGASMSATTVIRLTAQHQRRPKQPAADAPTPLRGWPDPPNGLVVAQECQRFGEILIQKRRSRPPEALRG